MRKLHGLKIIDQALAEPSERSCNAVVTMLSSMEPEKLAERVRRRATILCRQQPQACRQILRVRDRLILVIYGKAAHVQAFSAWCDASLKVTDGKTVAAISGLMLSPQGKLIAIIVDLTEKRDAVEAEAAAVTAVMQAALQRHVNRLRIHSDCLALVRLWLERREDLRLVEINQLANQFYNFEMYYIPRLHNQPADKLAKMALTKADRKTY